MYCLTKTKRMADGRSVATIYLHKDDSDCEIWVDGRNYALVLSADDAIKTLNRMLVMNPTARIEPFCASLMEQLSKNQKLILASLVGATVGSKSFNGFLAHAKPLDGPYSLRASAYAYIDAVKRFVDGLAPETRT